MGDLYDAKVLEWSEHQARLLRQPAAGEPGNEAPDWANITEEIESLPLQALAYMSKSEARPLSREMPGWQGEARWFRGDATACFAPSMRQRLDLTKLYWRTLCSPPDTIDGQPPLPVPTTCPVTVNELLRRGMST